MNGPVSRRNLATMAAAGAALAATSRGEAQTNGAASSPASPTAGDIPVPPPVKSQGATPATPPVNAGSGHANLTTNFGTVLSDDQNSLKAGARGPTLLEDFALREKIFHFDHERIPERVVHARGYGAHGYFELTHSLADYSHAPLLQRVGERTEVFVRFSTVAGSKGSGDLARDVRGFATKFYSKEGNWDLVGNNIPIFFIQDAIKFPDLIHAVKPEPDRGFPQAQSAHDTFWDYISLTPEAMHMIMWIMSDRSIPRSFRMMEGFGIHTFRLINAEGRSTFVKFHWRPVLGAQSVVWDEALKINGADPDFHRRDMWNAIEEGNFPEYELMVQLFDDDFAKTFPFDTLDATKIIPEELIPLRPVGRMVLNRNVSNFFAETEQVAFCTQNVVPGIDFSDDPLLQGRNFSYLDTQLKRLGSPNFQHIPVNAPRCPFANNQRDGHMQMQVPKGRVAYEPNSLSADGPLQNPATGYKSFAEKLDAPKLRHRSDTFNDHFSQARQFFDSQTTPEQNHIVSALVFELSKVEARTVRERMLSQLVNIRAELSARVARGLNMAPVEAAPALAPTRTDLPPSPALSILAKAHKTVKGRKIGVLVDEGFDAGLLASLRTSAEQAGADVAVVAPRIGGATGADGKLVAAKFQLAGGSSVLFDAVAILVPNGGTLARQAEAVAWVHDAYAHLKVIGHSDGATALMNAAGVKPDDGVVAFSQGSEAFLDRAAAGRIWAREARVRVVF